MKTLEHRLAWLAGIVDGEGTIYAALNKHRHVRRDGSQGQYLRLTVAVTNTDILMIEEVQQIAEAVGVKTRVERIKKRRDLHKEQWDVRVRGGRAVETLLEAILPYLVTKRSRAEVALAVIRHRRATSYPRNGALRSPVDGDAWLARQLVSMRDMNRRGAHEVSA